MSEGEYPVHVVVTRPVVGSTSQTLLSEPATYSGDPLGCTVMVSVLAGIGILGWAVSASGLVASKTLKKFEL